MNRAVWFFVLICCFPVLRSFAKEDGHNHHNHGGSEQPFEMLVGFHYEYGSQGEEGEGHFIPLIGCRYHLDIDEVLVSFLAGSQFLFLQPDPEAMPFPFPLPFVGLSAHLNQFFVEMELETHRHEDDGEWAYAVAAVLGREWTHLELGFGWSLWQVGEVYLNGPVVSFGFHEGPWNLHLHFSFGPPLHLSDVETVPLEQTGGEEVPSDNADQEDWGTRLGASVMLVF